MGVPGLNVGVLAGRAMTVQAQPDCHSVIVRP
jgi:hypothetical protein